MMAQIEPGWWMPDDLVLEEEKDLISLVAHSLNFDIPKMRAFAVAVLEAVDDNEAAVQVNELLGTLE
jgi:hypothetical protein